MTTPIMPSPKIHEGRNVKRIREMLQIKQEVLADELGMTQQNVSLLEQKETIDPPLLEKIAKAMNVPAEAIKNLNEESTITYINTFNDDSTNNGNNNNSGNSNVGNY